MIFGFINITRSAVETHNDSYVLDRITVVSARRPALASSVVMAGGLAAFGLSFADLLTPLELMAIATCSGTLLWLGLWLGNLQLVSRDLRGSELGTVIWGSYRRLNRKRREIAAAIEHVGARP